MNNKNFIKVICAILFLGLVIVVSSTAFHVISKNSDLDSIEENLITGEVIEVEAEEAPVRYWYTKTYLNCRTQPGTNHTIVTTYQPGISLIRTDKVSGDWEYVIYDGGKAEGWCHRDYLSEEPLSEQEISAVKERFTKSQKSTTSSNSSTNTKSNQLTNRGSIVRPTVNDNISKEGMRAIGTFRVTGYTPSLAENGGYDVTCTGVKLSTVIGKCVAADTKVLPLGTKIYIEGIGYRTVMDTGVRGRVIDVLVSSNSEARSLTGTYNVYIVE